MRSGGLCGSTMGHKGIHLSHAAVQREANRMRLRTTTPGPCTVKGCKRQRRQYWTANYDRRCPIHKDLDTAGGTASGRHGQPPGTP
jgi:hypothetical protein